VHVNAKLLIINLLKLNYLFITKYKLRKNHESRNDLAMHHVDISLLSTWVALLLFYPTKYDTKRWPKFVNRSSISVVTVALKVVVEYLHFDKIETLNVSSSDERYQPKKASTR